MDTLVCQYYLAPPTPTPTDGLVSASVAPQGRRRLLIPRRVGPFKGSIRRSIAKLNKDTKNIAYLSATLDIFSRCLSNCNCQKVIWKAQRGRIRARLSQ